MDVYDGVTAEGGRFRMIGSSLAHYRVTGKVGSGGMGDVYVADDTRLKRRVALKILPPDMARDPERRNRFEREARAVAALNHPNIVTIYSVETDREIHFITMELLEGRSLAEVLKAGGLPLGRLLELALPLTEAVSAAHMQGITHRDLKPDNIMVSRDGRVKVLDFGLAKVAEEESDRSSGSQAPTRLKTGLGRVLGTASYMSPEQAEGREIDQRSDVFSLGILLYEMATGVHPFEAESRASTVAAILRDEPRPVSEINRSLPRHLGRIVRICLAKDPLRRYQSAIDLRNELAELKRELDSGEMEQGPGAPGPPPSSRWRRPIAAASAAAAALAVALVAVGWGAFAPKEPPPPPPPASFSQLTDLPGEELFPSLSPDGKTVAYAARTGDRWEIHIQRVGGRNSLNLTAGDGSSDTHPAFSPDGGRIAFRSERDGGGIFVMGATGESVRRLTRGGYHPSWSPDGGSIVYSTVPFLRPQARASGSELWVVPASGGEPRRLVGEDAIQASWSPGGARIAYWGIAEGGGQRDIWTVAADGSDPRRVTDDVDLDWNPVWGPRGRYLYFSSDRGGAMNIWRVAIDQETGKVLDRPEPVTTGVGSSSGHISISAEGEIAYVSRVQTGAIYRVGFDPAAGEVTGPPEAVTRGSTSVEWPDLSPDGRSLAYSSFGRQEDIFITAADGSELRRLTEDSFNDRVARWSPDGSEIAFYSDRSGSYEIWSIRPDGSGLRQLTDTPGRSMMYPVWAPDGRRMAGLDHDSGTAWIFDPAVPWGSQSPEAISLDIGEKVRFVPWSWSPAGDRIIGSLVRESSQYFGLAVYDVASGSLSDVYPGGAFPVWLDGGRKALFTSRNAVHLLDLGTGRSRRILQMEPDAIPGDSVRVSADGRSIYFTRIRAEADIWLLARRPAPDPEGDRLRTWALRAPGPGSAEKAPA